MVEESRTEENKVSEFRFVEYFMNRPVIAGTLIYFGVSTIGVIYTWDLYRRFQINIFDYAEADDFILAAFKEPFSLFMTMITLLLIIGFIYLEVFIYRSFLKIYCLLIKSVPTNFKTRPSWWRSLLIPLLLPYLIFPALFFAKANSNGIIINKESIVHVIFEERREALTPVTKELTVSLIGSTEKFMFFYNHSDKNTIVIPITKIIRITTDKK